MKPTVHVTFDEAVFPSLKAELSETDTEDEYFEVLTPDTHLDRVVVQGPPAVEIPGPVGAEPHDEPVGEVPEEELAGEPMIPAVPRMEEVEVMRFHC